MKQYLLSVYQPDGDLPPAEILEPIMRDLLAWNQELRDAGAWVFGAGLHPPSTATVVRVKDSELLMTDGPFVEGKEHLGGFTVIAAPDLDAAVAWGRRLAEITTLPIEVRPLQGT
ncbi:YciI family protein [Actinokineospora sp.]|uniref:YciI family protein n=1 Tax=Actinokineospora sp. TaxID=1872133 RepID=UPI003D6BEFC7